MHPWLRKVCITNHVINNDEMRLDLKFGENCIGYDQYRSTVPAITIKEPSRRELNIVTSYNKLPVPVLMLCYNSSEEVLSTILRQVKRLPVG
ncbi:hypothetical protein OS493_034984 [Desmophyllum pertusum]|uniref:Uncharacterized protein n=1 Tax=Desmophyllum pertusum TaxID=174260 RepID=A0A9X0CCD6_9CNID|nr:hypothetical protein OS493_034984 [Desmophyllum pertusum]